MKKKITIIGGGNLGMSLAQGLISSGFAAPEDLQITRRNLKPLYPLKEKGVTISSSNPNASQGADVVVLAIKPYQAMDILAEIKAHLGQNATIISLVTGLTLKEIKASIGEERQIFRAMPNTAIAIRQSMTCICHSTTDENMVHWIEEMFNQLGKSVFINEALMEAATVLGACGTAYAMRYIRANIQGGIEIGFDANTANLIAAQTVLGAAQLLLENGTHPEAEIDKVTTPKGCTIAGLNEMEHRGFSSSLIKGIATSYKKIAKDDL